MGKTNQRRILPNITWKAEQYFLIFEFVLLMLTLVYLLYLIFNTVYGEVQTMASVNQVTLGPLFDSVNYLLLIRISILFCAVFLINALLGLFFLHRLTGPLVRFRAVLTQVGNGTVPNTDIVLRKGDFPTELASAMTLALKKIRQWRKQG